MDLLKSLWIFILISAIHVCFGRRNVLSLVADDMRPELGAYYGQDFPSPVHPPIHSPNLDKLAAKSLLLKRAYCQQAVCSRSRTSLLTGRRSDTAHVYDLQTYWRKAGGNFTTIPEYFKNNGYISIGMGKIFHPGIHASGGDDPISWSEPYFHAKTYWDTLENSWKAIPDNLLKDKPLVDAQTPIMPYKHCAKLRRWQLLEKNLSSSPSDSTGHTFHFIFPSRFCSTTRRQVSVYRTMNTLPWICLMLLGRHMKN